MNRSARALPVSGALQARRTGFHSFRRPSQATVTARQGFLLMIVLVIGTILLLLGITLHFSMSRQNANLHWLANGEIAHFLADAGINSCIRSVREAVQSSGLLNQGSAVNPLVQLLTRPQPLADTSLMPFLKDTWNADLKAFAAEVDPTAGIKVEVWLRDFQQTETDQSSWVDPVAKRGYLSIEATGEYRGVRRTLTVKRQIRVGGCLPPVVSKFTLHVKNAGDGGDSRLNIIRNDYNGNLTDGPRPFICYNHATPDAPFEAKPYDPAGEADPQVFQKRGWIWLGNQRVRLNLTSGPGLFGEIFHYYEVKDPSRFQAVGFVTPIERLPAPFSSPQSLPRDNFQAGQMAEYTFGHSFIFDGFHDKSNRRDTDAMYEGNILSNAEKAAFGSKSSLLHLYGEGRPGFMSRTRVLGNVQVALPRFASLEITPSDSELQNRFKTQSPPPTYLLPSCPQNSFDPNRQIKDFLGRRFGGPVLINAMLFGTQYDEYKKFMSAIVELPYVTGYNAMQDYLSDPSKRQFPPKNQILAEDRGMIIELKRGTDTVYKGSIDAQRLDDVIEGRIQKVVPTITEFWKTYLDRSTGDLVLNGIVAIENPDKQNLILPPSDKASPLKVRGGGLILLEQGNVTLRGVQLLASSEALTIIAPAANSVRVTNAAPQQVNVVAPLAEFVSDDKLDWFGCLSVSSIQPNPRNPGGVIRFREAQDPTRPESLSFAKVHIDESDSFWHE